MTQLRRPKDPSKEYAIFALIGTNPAFHFNGYTDNKGQERYIIEKKDKNGDIVKKRFSFRDGKLMIHKDNKEWIDFIKNAPFCSVSPNKRGQSMYTLVDAGASAKIRVENKTSKIKAQHEALNMDSDRLTKVAILCGSNSLEESVQRDTVLSYAETNPDQFLEIISEENMKDTEARSLIKRAVSDGVVKLKGSIIMWETVTLGSNEDDAVAKLLTDPELYMGIKKAHQRLLGAEVE